jgi:hypothetical protein
LQFVFFGTGGHALLPAARRGRHSLSSEARRSDRHPCPLRHSWCRLGIACDAGLEAMRAWLAWPVFFLRHGDRHPGLFRHGEATGIPVHFATPGAAGKIAVSPGLEGVIGPFGTIDPVLEPGNERAGRRPARSNVSEETAVDRVAPAALEPSLFRVAPAASGPARYFRLSVAGHRLIHPLFAVDFDA